MCVSLRAYSGVTERKNDSGQEAAGLDVLQFKFLAGTIKLLQSGAGIGQADAFAQWLAPWQAAAIVLNLQFELVILPLRPQYDLPRPRMPLDPVADRVLDERLEDEIWHARLKRFRCDVQFDFEAFPKASLFDLEVAIQEVQFLAQGHFVRVRVVECKPEQLAQLHHH